MPLWLASVSLLLFSGCATYQVPDFKAYLTLPASEDGFGISTISRKEVRIPKAQWNELKKRGIVLLSEDYAVLKKSIRQNCSMRQCTQLIGYFDELFLTLDGALNKVNGGN